MWHFVNNVDYSVVGVDALQTTTYQIENGKKNLIAKTKYLPFVNEQKPSQLSLQRNSFYETMQSKFAVAQKLTGQQEDNKEK